MRGLPHTPHHFFLHVKNIFFAAQGRGNVFLCDSQQKAFRWHRRALFPLTLFDHTIMESVVVQAEQQCGNIHEGEKQVSEAREVLFWIGIIFQCIISNKKVLTAVMAQTQWFPVTLDHNAHLSVYLGNTGWALGVRCWWCPCAPSPQPSERLSCGKMSAAMQAGWVMLAGGTWGKGHRLRSGVRGVSEGFSDEAIWGWACKKGEGVRAFQVEGPSSHLQTKSPS